MTMHRRTFTALLAGSGLAAGFGGLGHAAEVEVFMDPVLAKFEPESISIKAGDTVTWTNTQLVSHTVTCDPAKAKLPGSAALPQGAAVFDSGELKQDGTYKHQFTVKGEYKYFCIYHEDMKMFGTVIVT